MTFFEAFWYDWTRSTDCKAEALTTYAITLVLFLNRCACPKDRQVPGKDKPFLVDQRICRIIFLDSVNTVESKRLEKLKKR